MDARQAGNKKNPWFHLTALVVSLAFYAFDFLDEILRLSKSRVKQYRCAAI
jgi:hypothetical protein